MKSQTASNSFNNNLLHTVLRVVSIVVSPIVLALSIVLTPLIFILEKVFPLHEARKWQKMLMALLLLFVVAIGVLLPGITTTSPAPATGDKSFELNFFNDGLLHFATAEKFSQRVPLYEMGTGTFSSKDIYNYPPQFAWLVTFYLKVLPFIPAVWAWLIIDLLLMLLGIKLNTKLIESKAVKPISYALLAAISVLVLADSNWYGTLSYGSVVLALIPFTILLVKYSIEMRLIPVAILIAAICSHSRLHFGLFTLVVLFVIDWKFTLKTAVLALAFYVIGLGLYTVLSGDTTYALRMYQDYLAFTPTIPARIAIQGTEAIFNSFQNSWDQTFARYLGVTPGAAFGAALVKLLLLVPLGIRLFQRSTAKVSHPYTDMGLMWMTLFALSQGRPDLVELAIGCLVVMYLSAQFWADTKWYVRGYAFSALSGLISLVTLGLTGVLLGVAIPLVMFGLVVLYLALWKVTSPKFVERYVTLIHG